MLDGNAVPRLHPQVAARAVDGQMLVVLADRGEVMVLNDAGTQVWGWIDGRRSVYEIAGGLVETFGIEAGRAQVDTQAFLEALWDVKAVEG